VLLERLGDRGARDALASLDALYPQESGASVLAEVIERLVERELYLPAWRDAALRRRILHLCCTVPIALPHFFIAAMDALGEVVAPYPDRRPREPAEWA
jgi:hypothetical protein